MESSYFIDGKILATVSACFVEKIHSCAKWPIILLQRFVKKHPSAEAFGQALASINMEPIYLLIYLRL